jgi:BirA family biotin operon repressor/biotin-[acetyl-CoA-carboxylase] ligase
VSSFASLQQNLRTRLVGRHIHLCDRVASTNDVVWELADGGAGEGTVVIAEEQTSGRGRLGRTWWSPRGKGIWMSVLLRPPVREGSVPMTTIIGALATADAIRSVSGLSATIRWPNDILVGDRKVAGVLVEGRPVPQGRELVLGIGIDVNAAQDDLPDELADLATSLSEATGGEVDRVVLAEALLTALDRWYQVKLAQEFETINQRWRELSASLGRRIVLEEQGRRYEGEVIDVDVRLGLALRLDRGSIRHFRGEHVSVVQK